MGISISTDLRCTVFKCPGSCTFDVHVILGGNVTRDLIAADGVGSLKTAGYIAARGGAADLGGRLPDKLRRNTEKSRIQQKEQNNIQGRQGAVIEQPVIVEESLYECKKFG